MTALARSVLPLPASSFAPIAKAMRAHQRFLVVSHMRPDGDALGCQLAMGLCLLALGKEVKLWNEDGMLEKFRFLPHSDLVTPPPDVPEDFDVLIALDTATYVRLGTPLRAIGKVSLTINIDHHVSNPRYGDISCVDHLSPATGQVLCELIRDQQLPLTRDMAINLFAAISTDTGSFQYDNTTAHTFEIVGNLICHGIDVGEISRQLYGRYPLRRLQLLKLLLHTLKMTSEERVASFALSAADATAVKVLPEDNEGLIDYIRNIDTVQVAVFFEELPEGLVRVSMRSKSHAIDVSAICGRFGGGGHILAAGARIRGTLAQVQDQVLATIHEAILAAR